MSFDTRVVDNDSRLGRARLVTVIGLSLRPARRPPGTRAPRHSCRRSPSVPAEFAVIGHVALPAVVRRRPLAPCDDRGLGHPHHHLDRRPPGGRLRHRFPALGDLRLRVGHRRLRRPWARRRCSGTSTSPLPAAARLYANGLSRSSALADFSGPDVTAPDPLPVIMDGAKRDRVVWSGDLGRGGPQRLLHDGEPTASSGDRSSCWPATRWPTASRARTWIPPSPRARFPESRLHLLDLVLDGRGGQHRHLLPLHRRPLLRALRVADDHPRARLRRVAGRQPGPARYRRRATGMDWDYYDGSQDR